MYHVTLININIRGILLTIRFYKDMLCAHNILNNIDI